MQTIHAHVLSSSKVVVDAWVFPILSMSLSVAMPFEVPSHLGNIYIYNLCLINSLEIDRALLKMESNDCQIW